MTLSLLAVGCTTASDRHGNPVRSVRASWVEEEAVYSPVGNDFMFTGLSFPTARDGWIVGDRFVLHVMEDELEVAFVHPTAATLHGVDFAAPSQGWAAGTRVVRTSAGADPAASADAGVIWRYRDGAWTVSNLQRFTWEDWSLARIVTFPTGDALALGSIERDSAHYPGRDLLLRWDGTAWAVDDRPRRNGVQRITDACVMPNGDAWLVGDNAASDDRRHAAAIRQTAGKWQRVDLPSVQAPIARLHDVVCLADGRAFAAGWSDRAGGGAEPAQPLLLRFDETWSLLELPGRFRDASIGAIAAVSGEDLWVGLSRTGSSASAPATFLHWVGGEWHEVGFPPMPEGRVSGVSISAMQFVSPTEGWAIGNDSEGPGIVRGVIMHYKDGTWRNRNWTWSTADQPWFGLFGD